MPLHRAAALPRDSILVGLVAEICPRRNLIAIREPRAPAIHADARACDLARGSARSGALRGRVHGIERLARRHEQAIALRAAEADVTAHFGQPDAAEQLALRRPRRHAAVADGAAGIAGGPDIAVDVAAHAVRSDFTPSITHSLNRLWLVSLLSAPTSNTNISP